MSSLGSNEDISEIFFVHFGFMTPQTSYKSLSDQFKVSDITLATILHGVNISADLVTHTPSASHSSVIDLKFVQAGVVNSPKKQYIIGFVFRKDQTGKLCRINGENIRESLNALEHINESYTNTTLILVGKKGSRNDNKFVSTFFGDRVSKLIIRDFTSVDDIQQYLTNILSDIDKIELRYDCLTQ